MKRTEVNALLDSDLPAFLEANGLLVSFNEGRLKCHCCGRVIHQGNIHVVFMKRGQLAFCCDVAACISSYKESKSK
jgi:hypothetical protein